MMTLGCGPLDVYAAAVSDASVRYDRKGEVRRDTRYYTEKSVSRKGAT